MNPYQTDNVEMRRISGGLPWAWICFFGFLGYFMLAVACGSALWVALATEEYFIGFASGCAMLGFYMLAGYMLNQAAEIKMSHDDSVRQEEPL